MLVIGFWVLKLFLNLQRITPPRENAPNDSRRRFRPRRSTSPRRSEQPLVAPRAEPVDGPPGERSGRHAIDDRDAAPRTRRDAEPEPEVRRAQPVHPEDVPATDAAYE